MPLSQTNNSNLCVPMGRVELRVFLLCHLTAIAKSLQSCPTLWDPRDGIPTGSPIPGILQARKLEWAAISFSNAWQWKVKVKSLSSVRLRNPMDCSLPGSSAHGIFQARVLEWGAIAFSIQIYIKFSTRATIKVHMTKAWNELWVKCSKGLNQI